MNWRFYFLFLDNDWLWVCKDLRNDGNDSIDASTNKESRAKMNKCPVRKSAMAELSRFAQVCKENEEERETQERKSAGAQRP